MKNLREIRVTVVQCKQVREYHSCKGSSFGVNLAASSGAAIRAAVGCKPCS